MTDLLSRTIASATHMTRKLDAEEEMVIRHTSDRSTTVKAARRKSRSLLRSIEGRKRRGFGNDNPLVRDYLSNLRVKMLALHKAYRRLGMTREIPLVSVAATVNMFEPSAEDIGFRMKPKASGGERPIYCFGPINVARQIVMLDLLKALFDLPAWQYSQRGLGRDCAVRGIKAAALKGLTCFGSLDISDCFSSFDSDRMIEILSLPEDVVRYNIIAPDIRNQSVGSIRHAAIPHHLQPLPLGGLPQGSVASSYVSAILLSNLEGYLPPSVDIFMYGDDIVVLADTQAKVDAALTALRDGLHNHRSGSLRLKRCISGDLRLTALNFLGYAISVDEDGVHVVLSADNEYRLRGKWWHAVQEDIANVDKDVNSTRLLLDSVLEGFREADTYAIRDALTEGAQELVSLERNVVGVPQINYRPGGRRTRSRSRRSPAK